MKKESGMGERERGKGLYKESGLINVAPLALRLNVFLEVRRQCLSG